MSAYIDVDLQCQLDNFNLDVLSLNTSSLDAFSLDVLARIPAQGITAIYGPSGSGKTTFLRCFAGLEKNCKGNLHYDGEVWLDYKKSIPTEKRQLAYVFQEGRLFPHLNAEDNLRFAYRRRFNDGPSWDEVCEELNIKQLLKRFPSQLSGGERQRVAIARALLSGPRCLLLDDPLSDIDRDSKNTLLDYLASIPKRWKIPVIFVSNQLDEIIHLADHVVLMEAGKVSASSELIKLLARSDLPLAQENDASTVLLGNSVEYSETWGLSRLALSSNNSISNDSDKKSSNNISLWLPGNLPPSEEILRVRIPVKDVSITLEKPTSSSILNILPATILSIREFDHAYVQLQLSLAEQTIQARITRKSLAALALKEGADVYAQIKSVALITRKT